MKHRAQIFMGCTHHMSLVFCRCVLHFTCWRVSSYKWCLSSKLPGHLCGKLWAHKIEHCVFLWLTMGSFGKRLKIQVVTLISDSNQTIICTGWAWTDFVDFIVILTSAVCVPTSLMETRPAIGRRPSMRGDGLLGKQLEDAWIISVLLEYLDWIQCIATNRPTTTYLDTNLIPNSIININEQDNTYKRFKI